MQVYYCDRCGAKIDNDIEYICGKLLCNDCLGELDEWFNSKHPPLVAKSPEVNVENPFLAPDGYVDADKLNEFADDTQAAIFKLEDDMKNLYDTLCNTFKDAQTGADLLPRNELIDEVMKCVDNTASCEFEYGHNQGVLQAVTRIRLYKRGRG